MVKMEQKIEQKYDGWEERIENPNRFAGWTKQAAYFQERYSIPLVRSCVVSLKQSGALQKEIANILDIYESTVSGHVNNFFNEIKNNENLYDAVLPVPEDWGERELDPNQWLIQNYVRFEETGKKWEYKLYISRVGNAVENEWLIVRKKTEPTPKPGEIKITKHRTPISGSETLRQKLLYQSYDETIFEVANAILFMSAGVDPKTSIKKLINSNEEELKQLVTEIETGDEEIKEYIVENNSL